MKKWRVLSHFLHLECSFFLQYTVIICRADCLVSHGSSLWRLQIQEDCNTHCTFPWFWGFTLWFSSTYLLTYLLTYLTYLFHMCCCAVVRRQPWGVGFPLLWVSEETGLTSSGLAASVFTYSPISLPDQVCCKKKSVFNSLHCCNSFHFWFIIYWEMDDNVRHINPHLESLVTLHLFICGFLT